MSADTYQAVYDAVRSRIGGCDIGDAVERAIRSCGIGDQVEAAKRAVQDAVSYYTAPSVVYKPVLYRTSGEWVATYSPGGQLGGGQPSGRGETPAAAMADFDRIWYKKAGD